MSEVLLTTVDNPYNPFDNFEKWSKYDEILARQDGRPTVLSYLARKTVTSKNFTPKMQEDEMDSAINEIVRLNVTGKYMKITEEEAKKRLI